MVGASFVAEVFTKGFPLPALAPTGLKIFGELLLIHCYITVVVCAKFTREKSFYMPRNYLLFWKSEFFFF